MPRSSRGFSRRTSVASLRRSSSWNPGPFGLVSVSAAGSTVFGTGQQALESGLTIVRTHGSLLIRLVTSDAVTSGFDVAFGICVVNENAAGVGATAIPQPLTDIGWDGWLVHWSGVIKGAVPHTGGEDAVVRIPIDSKAMRKFKNTDVMVAVIQYLTEIGSVTLNADLRSRVLIKLP